MVFTSLLALVPCLSFQFNNQSITQPNWSPYKYDNYLRYQSNIYTGNTWNWSNDVMLDGYFTYYDNSTGNNYVNKNFMSFGFEANDEDGYFFNVYAFPFQADLNINIVCTLETWNVTEDNYKDSFSNETRPVYCMNLANPLYSQYSYDMDGNIDATDGDTFSYRFNIEIFIVPPSIYEASNNEDYEQGYNLGYSQGKDEGYIQGYNEGDAEGSADGYTIGYDNGYQVGFDTGAQSTHEYSFINLFSAVADTPVLMIRSLFDFDFFGVNLLTVVLSLFTGLILFYLLRKLL